MGQNEALETTENFQEILKSLQRWTSTPTEQHLPASLCDFIFNCTKVQIQKSQTQKHGLVFWWDIRAKEMMPLSRIWLKGLVMESKTICSKLLLREVEIFTQGNTASKEGYSCTHKAPSILISKFTFSATSSEICHYTAKLVRMQNLVAGRRLKEKKQRDWNHQKLNVIPPNSLELIVLTPI